MKVVFIRVGAKLCRTYSWNRVSQGWHIFASLVCVWFPQQNPRIFFHLLMDYCRKSLWQQNFRILSRFVHHDILLKNKHSFYSFWILNTIIDVKTITTRGYYLCIICCGIKGENILSSFKNPLTLWWWNQKCKHTTCFCVLGLIHAALYSGNHKYTLHIIFSVLQINIIGNLFSCKYWNILPLYFLMKCSWSPGLSVLEAM